MSEVKILMVDLNCPMYTDYIDLTLIPLTVWGKDMDNVEFLLVSGKNTKHIRTTNTEVFQLQDELMEACMLFEKEIWNNEQ